MALPIFDLCVKITSGFEGTDYGTVTGNFDGQGISCGILQWNLGAGTLQKYILNHINLMAHEFPVDMTPLWTMKPRDSVVWAKDMMLDVNGKLKPEWKIAWQKFLTDPTVVNVQKAAIGLYFHQAKCICGFLGFSQDNARAMAFSFDVAVQLWNLDVSQRPAANLEQAKNILQLYDAQNMMIWNEEKLDDCQQILVITSHLQALKAKPEWRKNVFARKATIAVGKGIVNKTKWDFKKLF